MIATIDGVDPMTYLYFWGDDLPKGGPPNPFPTTEKRHAAPLSSTQISDERRDLEAEGNLRKRDGDPPAVWLDRSRTLSAPQQLPNAQTRNALFMAARQWLDDIVTADHVDLTTGEISDDYEPARVGADVGKFDSIKACVPRPVYLLQKEIYGGQDNKEPARNVPVMTQLMLRLHCRYDIRYSGLMGRQRAALAHPLLS